MGGQRHRKKEPLMAVEHRQAILDTERVLKDDDEPANDVLRGDDVALEYYEDGYPASHAFWSAYAPARH
jgi:hypothetical protein